MDAVLHLAADPAPDAAWDSLLSNNIIGTREVFRAAIRQGVRKMVYASSIHAVSGYPSGWQAHADEPVCPGDEYGVSKCFGEAMGRYTSTQHGLSVLCVRIGAFQPREAAEEAEAVRLMNTFVSHRDLVQLFIRCLEDRTLRFAILHGLSNNRFNRMAIQPAMELLGYRPEDDFTELNDRLAALSIRERVTPHDERH